MYLPAAFREERVEILQALMHAYPLATLVSAAGGQADADHIPLLLEPSESPGGVLRGHVARANPLWRLQAGTELLVIFQGPQHYVSPSWYASKAESGKVVPTWNYLVVHARGRLQVHDDPLWVRGLVSRLTAVQEARFAQPWAVEDAPGEYLDRMLGAIVGIEIPVLSLVGKWKNSQNRQPADRGGVERGLRAAGGDHAQMLADAIAGDPRPAPPV